jgi:hypothetical protein
LADLILLEKDLGYTEKKLDELVTDFKNRDPAKETYSFISEVKLTMKGQTEDIKTLTRTLDCHVADQKENDKQLKVDIEQYHRDIFSKFEETQKTMTNFIESADGKYADSEQFRFWRNLLILGLIMSIAVGIIGILMDKYLSH